MWVLSYIYSYTMYDIKMLEIICIQADSEEKIRGFGEYNYHHMGPK